MTTLMDINLQIGMRLQMLLDNHPLGSTPPVFYTELIGCLDDKYLIVKTPFENGLSVQMHMGDSVTIRTLSGQDIYTLSCRVEHVFYSPHHYIHLSFSSDIKVIALRDSIRTKVHLPVQINNDDVIGIIDDISVTGAAIVAGKMLGEPGDDILIAFEFPIMFGNKDAHISTSATIHRVQQLSIKKPDASVKYSHGVSFHQIEPIEQMMLLILVYESINRLNKSS